MTWKVKYLKKPKMKTPVLIEGLPGIGNVGKVAVDFIIEEIEATKIAEFEGNNLPHSVFINENNLIELPTIGLYYKRVGKQDFLFVAGDAQPSNDASCYAFCDIVLNALEEFKGNEVVTLGGVALREEPQHPQVYLTGNQKKIVNKYAKGTNTLTDVYGKVGPIMGVSGVLLGLAQKRNIPAVSLLAETFGHPFYLGVNGARELLKVITKKLKIKVDLNLLDEEIQEIEEELGKKTQELLRKSRLKKLKDNYNYIG